MTKRITSLLLCLVMLFSMMPAAMHTHAATQTTVTVEADKTAVNPGDTVTYTVYLQSSIDIYAAQLYLDIPEGVTYVAGSGALAANVKNTLGADGDCSWVEADRILLLGSSTAFKNISEEKLAVATFQCTVDSDAAGTLTVNMTANHHGRKSRLHPKW